MLDKGDIIAIKCSNNQVSLRLVLGYHSDEIITLVREWYERIITVGRVGNKVITLNLVTLQELKEISTEQFKKKLSLRTYPITRVYVINKDGNLLQNYSDGNIIHKKEVELSLKGVFTEPCQDVLINNLSYKTSEYECVGAKRVEDLDYWLMGSAITGTYTDGGYCDRSKMNTLVDNALAKFYKESKKAIKKIQQEIDRGYVEVKPNHLYIHNKHHKVELLMYLGKTRKGKDAWVLYDVLSRLDAVIIYKDFMLRKQHWDNVRKLNDSILNYGIKLGEKKVYEVSGFKLQESPIITEDAKKKLRKRGIYESRLYNL